MYNYKSVRSSEPQIRSNPALRFVSENSGFQKRLSTLLEPISLPFPTFQIFKDNNLSILENHTHYAWVRPAHIRSTWIIVTDDMPLLMVDPRDQTKMVSLRIAFDKRKVQHVGPIIMEGAWDAQDHILWIWDLIYYNRINTWDANTYSQRWETLKYIVNDILDCGHPMSDAEIRLPEWESLESVSMRNELDTATSVEFQPEKQGKRRFLYLVRGGDVKFNPNSHHERKMVSKTQEHVVSNKARQPTQTNHAPQAIHHTTLKEDSEKKSINNDQTLTEKSRVGNLVRDSLSKLPDTYRLKTIDGKDLGLAAIRSLHISTQIRETMKNKESILVDIQWFEPFQKYEVKKIHT